MRRTVRLCLFILTFAWCGAAQAQIEIAFYSKDMASSFPHAYVRLTGTDERSGQPVDLNYGFTPASLGPGILFGPVRGIVESAGTQYIARSDRHFALKLTNAEYRTVLAIVEKWKNAPQPSYRLNSRNCISFVAEIANTLGISAPVIPKLMKKPRSYLDEVTRLNASLIAHWDQRPAVGPALAAQAHR